VESLLSPEGGLAAVFAASFLAATVVPFSSEAVLYGYLRLHPDHSALAIALATLGNTAGGMTTYLIGRLFPGKKNPDESILRQVRRYGAAATLLAWLPMVGDGLCFAAGWLRVNWLATLAFMAAGRLARYLAIAAL
jgi:membrane protein YqaA with SNARE-associated domain